MQAAEAVTLITLYSVGLICLGELRHLQGFAIEVIRLTLIFLLTVVGGRILLELIL